MYILARYASTTCPSIECPRADPVSSHIRVPRPVPGSDVDVRAALDLGNATSYTARHGNGINMGW